MRVRRAVLDDAGRVAEIHVLAWQSAYRGLLPQPLLDGLRPADRVPRWTATLRGAEWPGRGTILAEDAGEVIGFVDLRPTRDDDQDPGAVGEIAAFYVLPTAWGQGVGRHLMAAAVRTLGAAGYAAATLWVLGTNARAIGFYTHQGWAADGAARDVEVGGAAIRDLRYRRELG